MGNTLVCFLLSGRWEDRYLFHVCMVKMKLLQSPVWTMQIYLYMLCHAGGRVVKANRWAFPLLVLKANLACLRVSLILFGSCFPFCPIRLSTWAYTRALSLCSGEWLERSIVKQNSGVLSFEGHLNQCLLKLVVVW